MNWFKEIKLQYKDTFSHLPQSRTIADSLYHITDIVRDLSSKLHNYYADYFNHNISSKEHPDASKLSSPHMSSDTSKLNSPQTDCDILFRTRKYSKIDREQVTQMIEQKAAEHPTEMNLPIYNRQESFIEVITNWICSSKYLSPRDIKLAVNVLKHEDSINKNVFKVDATPVNRVISDKIQDLVINKYIGDDWYQMINGDEKIQTALAINNDKSKIIDLCFQRYQKFNQKDILSTITSNIDNLHVSPQNINTVYNYIQSTKNYDNDELTFFMDLIRQSSNERTQLSDDLVSKVCKLLFQFYKSSNVSKKIKVSAIETIEKLVDIYPETLGYHKDNTQQSFIDMITSSLKHSTHQKTIFPNSPQDQIKYDREAKFFINLIRTSIKNNICFSSKEGSKIVELLFNMYNSPKTSTVIHDNSVIMLEKFIDQHHDLAAIPLSNSKYSLGQLIAKSIEKNGKATIDDVQLATSVISNRDSDIHTKRSLLELLIKKYKHADKQKVLAKVIDAASPDELNLADADGNTFGHFFIKQYQQPNKYRIELLQQLLQSNKLNIAAQNNNGATILHLLNLNSYNDQILALEILKNTNDADLDSYCCLADKNDNKFIVNIIKSFMNGNNGLNEIINLALSNCTDSFLSVLSDMCNNSNLPKYLEIIDIIKADNNANAEDVQLYCTKFLKHLSQKNPEIAGVVEDFMKTLDSSASNNAGADEKPSQSHTTPPASAPELEELDEDTNFYNNCWEISPHHNGEKIYPSLVGEISLQSIEAY